MEQAIENLLNIDIELIFYAKVDEPSTTTTEGSGALSLTYANDKKSGTWTTGIEIDFYSVKASNQYALYYVWAWVPGSQVH